MSEDRRREAREVLRSTLADLCVRAEDECRNLGLHQLTDFTLVARDPANDEMSVIVTSEPRLSEVARIIAHLYPTERASILAALAEVASEDS